MEQQSTPTQTGDLPATPLTLDGSYLLHQMFRVRWPAWKALGHTQQRHILERAVTLFGELEANKQAATGLFSMLGHKGDLMVVHFRKTLDDLNGAELAIANSELNEYLEPTTSYLSVVELGLYEGSVKLYAELTAKGLKPGTADWNREARSGIVQAARNFRAAPVAGNPAAPLSVFLSDE